MAPNMADWLADDHLVWFILDAVEQLDTSAFHARRRTGGAGRAGYDPDMLLALLIYAYASGQRSSRRIERLCADHVAYRVVCAQDVPDHTTIARFRSEHDAALIDVFAQVLRLCAQAGMVEVGSVAIDGTKIAANASMSANRSQQWVREQARRIAETAVGEAAAVDAAEDAAEAAAGGPPPAVAPELKTRAGRAAAIAKAMAEIAEQDARQARDDAADADRQEQYLQRVEAGEVVAGAPPAGVDQVRLWQARLVRQQQRLAPLIGVRGTRQARQRGDIRKLVRKAEARLADAQQRQAQGLVDHRGSAARHRTRRAARGPKGSPVVNLTDPQARLMVEGRGGGSVQAYNSQIVCSDDHFVVGVHVSQDANDTHCWTPALAAATAHTQSLGKSIGLVLADNGYFTEDNLTSPGPDRLIAPGKGRTLEHDTRLPTQNPPPPDLSASEAMRHRLRNPDQLQRYRRRSATVEPVIGQLKDRTGLRRFARRGLQAVTAELHLAAAALNLTHLHHALR